MKLGLTFENDSVASENLQLVHFGLCHLDNRVVVLLRILDLKLMGRFLAVHNRSRVVLLSTNREMRCEYVRNIRFKILTRRRSCF